MVAVGVDESVTCREHGSRSNSGQSPSENMREVSYRRLQKTQVDRIRPVSETSTVQSALVMSIDTSRDREAQLIPLNGRLRSRHENQNCKSIDRET